MVKILNNLIDFDYYLDWVNLNKSTHNTLVNSLNSLEEISNNSQFLLDRLVTDNKILSILIDVLINIDII